MRTAAVLAEALFYAVVAAAVLDALIQLYRRNRAERTMVSP